MFKNQLVKAHPILRAASGKSDVSVIPGIVFISRTQGQPFLSTIRSTLPRTLHPTDLKASKAVLVILSMLFFGRRGGIM